MNLEAKITEEMKAAMKSGDKLRLDTVRSIRASILEFKTSGANKEMDETDEIKLLNSLAKKRKDSINMYEQAGRTELADKEKAELAVIMEFLPKQLTEDEVRAIVQDLITKTGASGNDGLKLVMSPVMKELKGKADGNLVQAIVKEMLGIA
jgi:uncharacterized protein YqeY